MGVRNTFRVVIVVVEPISRVIYVLASFKELRGDEDVLEYLALGVADEHEHVGTVNLVACEAVLVSFASYTIGEYLLKVRLDNAKFLLLNTNKSIENIAESCGFSSANYFSLMFKRKIGISPLNYRKPR
mgnify:CR=1 FL=1